MERQESGQREMKDNQRVRAIYGTAFYTKSARASSPWIHGQDGRATVTEQPDTSKMLGFGL